MCTCARQVPHTALPALHSLSGHFLLLIPKQRKARPLLNKASLLGFSCIPWSLGSSPQLSPLFPSFQFLTFCWLLLPPAGLLGHPPAYRDTHTSLPASLHSCVCTPPRADCSGQAFPSLRPAPPLHSLPPALARPQKRLLPRLPLTASWWPFLSHSLSLAKPDSPFHFVFVMFLDAHLPLCPHCYWPAVLTPMTPCLQLMPSSSGQITALPTAGGSFPKPGCAARTLDLGFNLMSPVLLIICNVSCLPCWTISSVRAGTLSYTLCSGLYPLSLAQCLSYQRPVFVEPRTEQISEGTHE